MYYYSLIFIAIRVITYYTMQDVIVVIKTITCGCCSCRELDNPSSLHHDDASSCADAVASLRWFGQNCAEF